MKTHLSAEGRVITFGLSKEENTIVKNALPTQKYELLDTDAPTDLIAISAAALIINSAALDADSREQVFDYYTEVSGCTDETVFWIGNPKPPKQLLTNFKYYESFEELATNLKYHLLSAHSKSKKAKDFSKQLGKCLQIMQEVLNMQKRSFGLQKKQAQIALKYRHIQQIPLRWIAIMNISVLNPVLGRRIILYMSCMEKRILHGSGIKS